MAQNKNYKNNSSPPYRSAREWDLRSPYGARTVLIIIIVFCFIIISGKNSEINKMAAMIAEAIGYFIGVSDSSQVVNGLGRALSGMWPLQISETTEISRIQNFNPNDIPVFSRIETQEVSVSELDPVTLQLTQSLITREVLVQPLGYVKHVSLKMIETVEIAIWATIFACIISTPLAYFAAKNYTPNRLSYNAARSIISMFRSVPELISAMFFVLAFGFGPVAGIIALGFHSAGFLGKFFAEDIENADIRPQEALISIGANKIKTLRFAVLPQVLPQYVAYILYILDRNVRMATVIGIVGAGGIGQELKGRYDMFDYGHVATILLLIFFVVLTLDKVASSIRAKLI